MDAGGRTRARKAAAATQVGTDKEQPQKAATTTAAAAELDRADHKATKPVSPAEPLQGRSDLFNTIKGSWPFLTAEEKAEFLSWIHDNEYALYHKSCVEAGKRHNAGQQVVLPDAA